MSQILLHSHPSPTAASAVPAQPVLMGTPGTHWGYMRGYSVWGATGLRGFEEGSVVPGPVPTARCAQHLGVLPSPQPRGDAGNVGPTGCCKWIITQSN